MKKNSKVRFWVSLVLEILFCLCLGFALGFICFSSKLSGVVFVGLFTSITTICSLCFSFVFLLKKIIREIRERK